VDSEEGPLRWPDGSFQFSRTRQEIEVFSEAELATKTFDDFSSWLHNRIWKEFDESSVKLIREFVYSFLGTKTDFDSDILSKHVDVSLACAKTTLEIMREIRQSLDELLKRNTEIDFQTRLEGGDCLNFGIYLVDVFKLFRAYSATSEWEKLDLSLDIELDNLIETSDAWIKYFD
jgi:hypothetical protein